MQRYSASELPQQNAMGTQPAQNAYQQQAVQHAIQLGAYILEQRGREGATAYTEGLLRVLPEAMVASVCGRLQIPLPQLREETSVLKDRQETKKQRAEPDMEMILKLMQMMQGKDTKDLSALMQLIGRR